MRTTDSQRPGRRRPISPPAYRRNRKRRNWRPIIVGWLAIICVAALVTFLLTNERFQIKRVEFVGNHTVPRWELARLVRIPPHRNVFIEFLLHHKQIAQQVKDGEPVVADDYVRPGSTRLFGWPNELKVHVTERTAYVQLRENHGGLWLVDKSGVPYREITIRKPGLTCVVVPFGSVSPTMGLPLSTGESSVLGTAFTAYNVVNETPAVATGVVKDIRVDQSLNLCLNTSNNLLIKLGQADNLQSKIEKAGAILTDASQQADDAVYIDVTEPDHPALMPRPGLSLVGASSN